MGKLCMQGNKIVHWWLCDEIAIWIEILTPRLGGPDGERAENTHAHTHKHTHLKGIISNGSLGGIKRTLYFQVLVSKLC